MNSYRLTEFLLKAIPFTLLLDFHLATTDLLMSYMKVVRSYPPAAEYLPSEEMSISQRIFGEPPTTGDRGTAIAGFGVASAMTCSKSSNPFLSMYIIEVPAGLKLILE